MMLHDSLNKFVPDAACSSMLFCPDEGTRGNDLELPTTLERRV